MRTPLAARAFTLCALALISGRSNEAQSQGVTNGESPWQVDTVDSTGAGKFSSLKIDRNGSVHVAYILEDGNQYPLKYAVWSRDAHRWFTMQVASGAGVCSLALDSKQRPHISWDDYGTGLGAKLRYAHWDGTAWRKEAIQLNSQVIAYYNSIALDNNDNPAISFYEYQGPPDTDFRIRLRSVIWNGQDWDLRTVDPQPGSGKFNFMVADAKGHLHIAYANVSAVTAGMRYAFWDGKIWKSEILEGLAQTGGDGVGFSAAIALDKDGGPHVTYMDETTPRVKYAVRRAGRWQIQIVDTVTSVAYPDRNSIAITDDGVPYLGYYDAGRGALKVAHLEGSRWVKEVVDSNGAGFTSSMGISDGTIWISYADGRGALKVAHRKLADSPTAQIPPAAVRDGKN